MTALLLDTHIAMWLDGSSRRLNERGRRMIGDATSISFSVVSLWEVVIKNVLGRADFLQDARALRRSLLAAGYDELPILAPHVFEVGNLPDLRADPFDRLLVAQARSEGVTLLTADTALARYGTPVELM